MFMGLFFQNIIFINILFFLFIHAHLFTSSRATNGDSNSPVVTVSFIFNNKADNAVIREALIGTIHGIQKYVFSRVKKDYPNSVFQVGSFFDLEDKKALRSYTLKHNYFCGYETSYNPNVSINRRNDCFSIMSGGSKPEMSLQAIADTCVKNNISCKGKNQFLFIILVTDDESYLPTKNDKEDFWGYKEINEFCNHPNVYLIIRSGVAAYGEWCHKYNQHIDLQYNCQLFKSDIEDISKIYDIINETIQQRLKNPDNVTGCSLDKCNKPSVLAGASGTSVLAGASGTGVLAGASNPQVSGGATNPQVLGGESVLRGAIVSGGATNPQVLVGASNPQVSGGESVLRGAIVSGGATNPQVSGGATNPQVLGGESVLRGAIVSGDENSNPVTSQVIHVVVRPKNRTTSNGSSFQSDSMSNSNDHIVSSFDPGKASTHLNLPYSVTTGSTSNSNQNKQSLNQQTQNNVKNHSIESNGKVVVASTSSNDENASQESLPVVQESEPVVKESEPVVQVKNPVVQVQNPKPEPEPEPEPEPVPEPVPVPVPVLPDLTIKTKDNETNTDIISLPEFEHQDNSNESTNSNEEKINTKRSSNSNGIIIGASIGVIVLFCISGGTYFYYKKKNLDSNLNQIFFQEQSASMGDNREALVLVDNIAYN